MYSRFLKSFFDIFLSLMALIFLLPIFFIIMLILYVANNGKVFFVQSRPGKKEKLFQLIKFKTMTDKKDLNGELLADRERLTNFGKFIRRTSLDELPQLLNIIKGDMSLIGPRPLLPEYLPFYSIEHKRRHNVKPGITGLAQISGRQNIKFSERFDLDVKYADNITFLMDLKILCKTFLKIFQKKNVILGQTVDEVDDLGITQNLPSYHFKKNYKR